MVTSLMTSLHDTTISDLNHGFKEASKHFKKIIESTSSILNATTNNPDIDTILLMLKDTAVTMEFVIEVLADDSMEKMGLAVASFITLVVILQAGTLIKLIRDIKLNIKEMNDRIQELQKAHQARGTQHEPRTRNEDCRRQCSERGHASGNRAGDGTNTHEDTSSSHRASGTQHNNTSRCSVPGQRGINPSQCWGKISHISVTVML